MTTLTKAGCPYAKASTLNVDLVIVGMTANATAVATDASRRGLLVLVVGESKDAGYCRGLRRKLDGVGDGCRDRVTILAGFEVVSVDGIGAVEVVLIRQVTTGQIIGINTSAIVVTIALPSCVIAPAVWGRVEKNPTD